MLTESKVEKVYNLIREKRELEARIDKMLGNGFGVSVMPLESAPAPKRHAVNGKILKLRKLQGRYLGAVRPLTKLQRKQVSKIREAKGYTAAISKAKQLAAR